MAGPTEAINALAKAVGAKNHVVPCASPGLNITFELDGGLEVVLTKKDYTVDMQDGDCLFPFYGFDNVPWLLGLPFLEKVYTVLDYGDAQGQERIGLALIKRH